MKKQEEIREGMAELEHEQWVVWAYALMEREKLSPERIERWQKLMIPYSELTEEQKDQDRKWADISLKKLHSQGVVTKVDKKLPSEPMGFYMDWSGHKYPLNPDKFTQEYMLKAGYTCTELIIDLT